MIRVKYHISSFIGQKSAIFTGHMLGTDPTMPELIYESSVARKHYLPLMDYIVHVGRQQVL